MFGFNQTKKFDLERLRSVLDVMPTGIAYYDPDDICAYFNTSYVAILESRAKTGMSFSEIMRANLRAGLYPHFKGTEDEFIAEAMARRKANFTIERPVKSGWVRIEDVATPCGGRLSTIIDITELRQQRLDLERKQQEASEARTQLAAASAEQSQVVALLAAGLDRLASGDLESRITGVVPTSYTKLVGDFNAAVDQLQPVIQGISSSAAGVQGGAAEIARSAQDLSHRTEQQAATLEETAAALSQITETVRRTADGAASASAAVAAAKSDAEASGAVMRGAVASMSEIEGSAQQISQIIGMIDEIAFQTNLLALNAGVEAARAGDAGRGFAVVASEVRALAQRSAAAAKEIKALIATSSVQVAGGVRMVGEAGQALDRISSQVSDINGLTAEIAIAAQEQAASLQSLNASMREMDRATQQNAGMAQESTAAAASLDSEAAQLGNLLKRFSTGSRAAAVERPARRWASAG